SDASFVALNVSSRCATAVVAASPPSFQPAYARITIGCRRSVAPSKRRARLRGPDASLTLQRLAHETRLRRLVPLASVAAERERIARREQELAGAVQVHAIAAGVLRRVEREVRRLEQRLGSELGRKVLRARDAEARGHVHDLGARLEVAALRRR